MSQSLLAAEPPEGTPAWMLTFGDLMALLLTFFVMLTSMGEFKSDERFQSILTSMRKQFGATKRSSDVNNAWSKPRDPRLAQRISRQRGRRQEVLQRNSWDRGTSVESPVTHIVRPGEAASVGTTLAILIGAHELDDAARGILHTQIALFSETGQGIEIHGYTASRDPADVADSDEEWLATFARSHWVRAFLISEGGIDPDRIRLRMSRSAAAESDRANFPPVARVDVYLLDELEGRPAHPAPPPPSFVLQSGTTGD